MAARGLIMRRTARTFSLIELIFVLAIIGILTALAVPRFGSSIAFQRADMAADRIVADLSLARERAVTTSSSLTVQFKPGSNAYALQGMQHLDRSGDAYDVDLSAEPYEATLVSADFGGDTEVVFDGYGVPDSGGTVIIQVGGETRTITLDAVTARAGKQ